MRNNLRFVLGDTTQDITAIEPTQTVLEWLRASGHTGTKEGCAEGDCGACTVVIGRPNAEGGMVYRAVNACILFMPMLDGAQLLTVEHLARRGGDLHPVQQALVDHHASQCGFCTPGFVMSLYALYRSGETPTRARLHDVLAGNLCRCTGYRSIMDAAMHMHCYERVAEEAPSRMAARLTALIGSDTLNVGQGARRFIAPRDLAGVHKALAAHPKATVVAGATDVGLWVTKQHRDLAVIVYLGQAAQLQAVEAASDHVLIGGAVTHSAAMASLAGLHADIGELFRRFASTLIRNSSTVGGNIANGSPIGDSMPVLMALGAKIELVGPASSRWLALEDLYVDYQKQARTPDEIVARVRIPRLTPNQRYGCYKLSKRFDQDISAVCAAFCITRDDDGQIIDARLAFGGMAATPIRARAAERALVGAVWDQAAVAKAQAALAKELSPISDMRASAAYRRRATGQLLQRFWHESSASGAATRLLAEEAV